ncbi:MULTISPECIES: DUF4922 domain-containing protein [Prochlorococcus]|uniref:DUF4922 domain-containing protein n=1 Tax=Prochlorococcus TaxID=1218 RepID=UPI000533B05A|nr:MULTISPECIES: DUF4922 domain-containing protein [Prochlorococcus]KGG12454.1 putative ATP adenylyltransferase [Prochlorococcus sp. MIT 0601]
MTHELFWNKALELTKTAIAVKSLIPLETLTRYFPNTREEIFEIRTLVSSYTPNTLNYGPHHNPFHPWDTNLEISNILDKHVLILNKYPVQPGHMLLITKNWEPQDGWLTLNDWSALSKVNEDTKGLWFFNSGPLAGASQPHRHLQLLRRTTESPACPRDNWFTNLLNSSTISDSILSRSCDVRLISHTNLLHNGDYLYENYLGMCKKMDIGSPEKDLKPKYPYNLLITSNWMALIRRSKECAYGFSINALGFAGYLLCRDNSNLDWLEKNGPVSLLENVVFPII